MDENPNWKALLKPGSRLRIVNKIVGHIKQHLPFSSPDGLLSITKMAVTFEEKMFTDAVTQRDYLRKISLKMLIVESWPLIDNNLLTLNPPNQELDMDDTRWRTHYQAYSRLRIINKILDTSMGHNLVMTPAEFLEATEVAVRFEENSFSIATSESDYLHKITMKILSMEVNCNDT